YIWAIKLTQALGFIFAAVALYALCRELGHQRAASLFAALVYSCAPFHMVNIYVRGDSLSEFYAFAFFPLILWSLLRLQKQLKKEGTCPVHSIAAVALSYTGLMLTHNISALIFSPFVLLYALWLAWNSRHKLRYAIISLSALMVGALLSAWFWLPALAEAKYVHLEEMTTGYFNYALHFRGLDLVQRSLIFDYGITADKNPFRMGLVQAVLALAGIIAIVIGWIRQRRMEAQSAFGVLLLAFSTWMITPLSRPLWDNLPLLPMVQFPWRFLSLQALGTSLVAAYLIPRPHQPRQWVTILVSALVLFSMLRGLHPERLLIQESDVTTERLMLYEYFTANIGTTIRNDYLPRWVDPRPFTSEAFWQGGSKPAPLALDGQISAANLIALGPTSERWVIEVVSPQSLLAFHTYFYPSWQALVDGQRTRVEALPGLGYIGLRLSQGAHEVLLYLGHTRIQLIAEALSALTAVTLFVTIFWESRHSQRMVSILVAVFAAVVLLMIWPKSGEMATVSQPTGTTVAATSNQWDLGMDFDRIPYLHHNPDGIRFGDATRLISYELSALEVEAGEVLTVTTHWSNVPDNPLGIKIALVSPAQHLFGVPQAIAVAEKPLTTDRVMHTLPIPQNTMRGVYLLNIQVQGPEGEIRPVNARGETLGTMYLLPVRIHNWMMPTADEPILQKFSEHIALSKAQIAQNTPGVLEVMLTWQVLATPPQNYKIALRLKDPSGWDVAKLDTQPGYGFYPTSMWRPGELVHDHYTLSLDDGTPPGASYSLQVTLYESSSLQPIGTATISNVAVVHPTTRHNYPVLHKFNPALALSEAQLSALEIEQGAKLTISLKWAAVNHVEQDYECRVALRDGRGTILYQETQPLV
ncbi:MAG: hypothetical protein H5T63_03540, partial [Chloroflexi bacterium]|nr:hypothetical protein [Chloroflexota bacterium]